MARYDRVRVRVGLCMSFNVTHIRTVLWLGCGQAIPCHTGYVLPHEFTQHCLITLHAKLSGTVYCYRSCLCRAGRRCLWVGLLPR